MLKTKTHLIPMVISFVGLIIAIVSYFKSPPPIQQTFSDDKFDEIEIRLEKLENSLKKEMDSLKGELLKVRIAQEDKAETSN